MSTDSMIAEARRDAGRAGERWGYSWRTLHNGRVDVVVEEKQRGRFNMRWGWKVKDSAHSKQITRHRAAHLLAKGGDL